MYGWRGAILRVDLTAAKITVQPLEEQFARDFIGGRGFNSMTLFNEVKPGIDPLGPDNVLCLAPGPFTGTQLGLSSRIEVSTLSPLSGILGDGNGGGSFATVLKRAGYDQIVITGKTSSPQYLWIEDEKIELRDAAWLMGKSTWETTDSLQQVHGKDISVGCIGQAGENLVRFASTIFDKYNSAARGSGAVLGSKKLKAIAVRGTGQVNVARPQEFSKLAKEDREFFLKNKFQRETVGVYGSHIGVMGWGPGFRNFQKYWSAKDVPEDLRPEAWKKYEVKRVACLGCVVGCKNEFRIPQGKYAGETGKALEYEAIYCLGINSGVLDPMAIMEMENLADKYGMCVVALGNAVALAKGLYNMGIITKEDTGGLSLDWEDASSQIKLLHQIALRKGFGNLVAEGMYSLAKIIGRGAMDYCYHVKGLSRGVYPAGMFSLAHATSTRGADHLRGRSWAYGENDQELFPDLVQRGLIPQDTIGVLTVSERATTLADVTGRCKGAVNSWVCAVPLIFKYPLWDGVAKLLHSSTGCDYSAAEVEKALDRVYSLEMAFNARQGITRKHDCLPQKPEVKETPAGKAELKKHAEMLTEYYRAKGCDLETGIPTRERLEYLGLKQVADILNTCNVYPDWDGPPLWPLDKYPRGNRQA